MLKAQLARAVGLWRYDRDNLLQKVRKKLRNKVPLDKMLLSSGRAFWPVNLTFEITHLCNLSCYMCDLYGTDAPLATARAEHYRQEELLTLTDLERVAREVAAFKPSIALTGGEPLISPLSLPFIRACRREGLVTTMTCNGMLLEAKAAEVVTSGLNTLTLSLDGVGAVHDHVRGKEGSFARLDAALSAVQREKVASQSGTPSIQFNVTITSRNQGRLHEILEYAVSRGVHRVIFSHLWYWDEPMVKKHNALWGHIAPAEVQNLRALEGLDIGKVTADLERIRTSPLRDRVDVKFLPDIDEDGIRSYYTRSMDVVRPSAHCLSPWMNTRILPNGDVIPCLDSRWGNLRTQSFGEVWNSKTAMAFRVALRDEGVWPGCMRCCGLYSYE
ncbi:MAG: radical SAM protein [Planctomycetota bacterium]